MATLLDWNGKELPKELRTLPTGRYVIEPVDRVLDLTAEEEAGLEAAARSLDAGEGLSLDVVRWRLERTSARFCPSNRRNASFAR